MSTPNPGLRAQGTTRIVLRVVGGLLLVVGVYLGATGLQDFASTDPGSGSDGFGRTVAGGFMAVFGLAALAFGFLGAQARYAAGETMPVVRDSASYLSDGQGIMGVGATGPFCRSCGQRNDHEARFCDGCGKALA